MTKKVWSILSLAIVVVSLAFGFSHSIAGTEGTTPASGSAVFEVRRLMVSPEEAVVGDKVKISVTVENTGYLEGTYTLGLKIEEMLEATQDVTLAGGAEKIVLFTFTLRTPINEPKTYWVHVNGLTGAFRLKPAVEILGYSGHPTSDGYSLVGEVENKSSRNLGSVEIVATFYNADGALIAGGSCHSYINVLEPQQKSPFRIDIELPHYYCVCLGGPECYSVGNGVAEAVESYRLMVKEYKETDVEPYRGFAIHSYREERRALLLEQEVVVVEVENTGSKEAEGVEVVATSYDDKGTPVKVERWRPVVELLAPGETVIVKTLAPRKWQRPHSLQVQCRSAR